MNTADALALLLDEQWVSTQLGRPARVTHLRIKPEVAIIAAWSSTEAPYCGDAAGWLRLLWPVSHSKARKANAQARRLGASTTSRMVCADSGLLAGTGLLVDWGQIHTDPALAPHLHRWLPTLRPYDEATHAPCAPHAQQGPWHLLRYNPLRRVVARDGHSVVRVYATPQPVARQVVELVSHAVPTPPILPVVSLTDAESNVAVSTPEHVARMAVCGDGDIATLFTLNSECGSKNRSERDRAHNSAHEEAGRLFAQLHSSTHLLNEATHSDLRHELSVRAPNVHAQAQAHGRILDHLDPQASARLRRITEHLNPTPTQEHRAVLSHGDASPDQILTTANLAQMWMTDFDRACLATPALDLGSYTGQCSTSGAHSFLHGYAQAGGEVPSKEELRHAQITSLIARIAEPLKHAHPDWHTQVHHRLDTIEELLG